MSINIRQQNNSALYSKMLRDFSKYGGYHVYVLLYYIFSLVVIHTETYITVF